MGNVLALAGWAAEVLMGVFRRPDRENPTLDDIQARREAEEAQRQAEQAAREAQENNERVQHEAELQREQARERQAEADRAAARAAEEAERTRVQMEEASNAARRVQELAEEASRAAREEAERRAREEQEGRERARRAKEDAERAMADEASRAAREEAERRAREAQEGCERAWRAKEDAERAMAEKAERVAREEAERAVREEVERAAREEQEERERIRRAKEDAERAMAEEASRVALEEAERLAREAQEECERAWRAKEDSERAMAAAKEEAERTQRAADEERREIEAAKALADEVVRAAAEETRKAVEAMKEAERHLKEGIQPVVTPSPEEVAAAKRRIQYKEDCFHFAIAGISGGGKSSLVNAFRGLHTKDASAAAVGVTETTDHVTRYPDANPENPFVWYDIPGAGTLNCGDWQYFNEQGLYVFDCIIVVFDNRFTEIDVAILLNAKRFNIPTYIVRSKADQHISNVIRDMEYDSDEEDGERRNRLNEAARKKFIDETRRSVRINLEDASLPDQHVYIISSSTMLKIVRNKLPKKAIDEVELVNDLLNQAYSRRVTQSNKIASSGASSGSRR